MSNLIAKTVITAAILISQANADMMMRPEDIQAIHTSLRGQTIVQPQAMIQGWLNHKAKTLQLGAQSMEEFATQFKKDKCGYREWMTTAKKMKKLAKRFENLSVPRGKLVKNMAHMDDWMMLKAEKMALKAEQMKIIAGQMTDAKVKDLLLKKAQEVAQIGRMIRETIAAPASSEVIEVVEEEEQVG